LYFAFPCRATAVGLKHKPTKANNAKPIGISVYLYNTHSRIQYA
jgi:hypothetical protein